MAYNFENDLYLANWDGSGSRQLTSTQNGDPTYNFPWRSLGGYFNGWFGGELLLRANADTADDHFEILDPATSRRWKLPTMFGSAHVATGTPDGERYVLVTNSFLTIVANDGAIEWNFAPPDQFDRWSVTDVSALSISADGSRVIATACTDVCKNGSDPGGQNLFKIDLDEPDPTPLPVTADGLPGWLAQLWPDGSQIVYVVPGVDGAYPQLWRIGIDGTGARTLDVPSDARV